MFSTFFRFVTSETPAMALVLPDTVLFPASLFSGHAVHFLLFLAPRVISQCLCPSWGQMNPIRRSSVRANSGESGFVRCIDMPEPRSLVFTLSSQVSIQRKGWYLPQFLGLRLTCHSVRRSSLYTRAKWHCHPPVPTLPEFSS